MVKVNAICEYIQDGDTFRTDTQVWIRLARVDAPKLSTMEGKNAKRILEFLIQSKLISYEPVATDTYGRTLAEVWVNNTSVNDYMIAQDYVHS